MDVPTMNAGMARFLQECDALARKKNPDYHPDGVAYLEILQTAWETDITVEKDIWARLRKQLSALRRFVIEGHLESEPPRQRMIDVANYMAILAVWEDHKRSIVTAVYDFVNQNRPCEYTNSLDHRCLFTAASYNPCDACAFRSWLGNLHDSLASAERLSRQTLKPLA